VTRTTLIAKGFIHLFPTWFHYCKNVSCY